MQSTVAKRMRTGPPFSFRRENGGSKNPVFRARKHPIQADYPLEKGVIRRMDCKTQGLKYGRREQTISIFPL